MSRLRLREGRASNSRLPGNFGDISTPLNGVLFIDYLSKLKRDRVQKKFSKAAKRAAE